MIKSIVRILAVSAFFIIAAVTTLFFLQPRIPLGVVSGPVSSLLTFFTGYEQVVSGNYFLVPGTWTTFSVENGSVNLTGDNAFTLKAEINSAQTKVHLLSLFRREINLDGIAVHGMTLDVFTEGKKKPSDTEKKEENHAEFRPFILKQTGSIDLADITAVISSSETASPITFQLIKARGEFSQEAAGKFAIEAVLNDRDFGAELEGGPLQDLAALETDWPFTIHMSHKSLSSDVSGSISNLKTDPRLTVDVSLSGEHFDDLASIFGSHGSKNQPFALQGNTVLSKGQIQADLNKVQAGTEIFQLSASVQDYGSPTVHYSIKMQDDSLNLDTLKDFFTGEEQKTVQSQNSPEKTKITRDDILFPETFPVSDLTLDLDLDLKEVVMAGKEIKDIRLNVVMDDGLVIDSPFKATFPHSSLSGYYTLNLRNPVPEFSAHLETRAINVGEILKDLQLVDDIVLHLDSVTSDLKTSGRTLGELFDNFAFTITANNGKFEYQDPNTGTVLPVILENTEIVGVPGEKIAATMHGKIGSTPVSFVTEFDDRRDEPPGSVKDISVTQQIRIAGAQWELAGNIPLPVRTEGIELHSRLAGEQLSSLNDLLHLHLPDIGPYAINGNLSIVPEGYRLNGIHLQVGSSSLDGDILVDTKTVPPALRIELQSQRIQLDDFKAIQLKPRKALNSSQKSQKDKNTIVQEKKYLTDKEVLDSYNAFIHVAVDKVLSGEDFLGGGTLNIEQKNGRFMINSLDLQLPGGTVSVDFSLEQPSTERHYRLNALIKELDYGIVARWFKPDTDMSGIINLRASMDSVSPDRQGIMANGSGQIDFSLQPRQLRAGVIDLWAVNIFSYLTPFLTPKGESTINCAAGRFNLEEGKLQQEEFLIDTSRIRVKGVVAIDFNKQLIDATLRPIPKRPQFYSLSTPIKIQGSLSDLDAGVARGGAISTMIRLATSYIVVPLQWVIQNKLPEDGTEACLQLMKERTE